jgi:Leucine-rich repeat (LRR) protein
VDLARNQLTKVEFQMFADLRFIDTIDLAENQISEVQREAFKNIYLTRINMSHNFIEELADNVFRNCENMTFLDLSHNYIYGILPTTFGDNSYTLDLRLDYNYLTSMAGVPMDHQIGIKMLNVSHNQVIFCLHYTSSQNAFIYICSNQTVYNSNQTVYNSK